MAMTRASRISAGCFGAMKDVVPPLKAAKPYGTIILTGQRARRSFAKYDLTRLSIGTEARWGHSRTHAQTVWHSRRDLVGVALVAAQHHSAVYGAQIRLERV